VNSAINLANFLLSTAMWLIVGRLVLRLFIRDERNAVWQMFVIATEPPYRVSRALTLHRLSERWTWLVSLAWLLALRILLTSFYHPVGRSTP
jgi:hypothetical protein